MEDLIYQTSTQQVFGIALNSSYKARPPASELPVEHLVRLSGISSVSSGQQAALSAFMPHFNKLGAFQQKVVGLNLFWQTAASINAKNRGLAFVLI